MNSTLQFELKRANDAIAAMATSPEALTLHGNYRDGAFHLDYHTGKLIAEFEVLDHGIDHAQYFQGCGTSYTDFDHVATGCGDNFAEAFEDALDCLAQDGFDVDGLTDQFLRDEGLSELPVTPASHDDCHTSESHTDDDDSDEDCEECKDHEECELYYYVSVRVKE